MDAGDGEAKVVCAEGLHGDLLDDLLELRGGHLDLMHLGGQGLVLHHCGGVVGHGVVDLRRYHNFDIVLHDRLTGH